MNYLSNKGSVYQVGYMAESAAGTVIPIGSKSKAFSPQSCDPNIRKRCNYIDLLDLVMEDPAFERYTLQATGDITANHRGEESDDTVVDEEREHISSLRSLQSILAASHGSITSRSSIPADSVATSQYTVIHQGFGQLFTFPSSPIRTSGPENNVNANSVQLSKAELEACLEYISLQICTPVVLKSCGREHCYHGYCKSIQGTSKLSLNALENKSNR